MGLALALAAAPSQAASIRVTTWDLQPSAAAGTNGGSDPFLQSQIQDAAESLKKLRPDVIMLQGVAGWETCRQLAQALRPEAYQVVICSSFRDSGARLLGRQVAILSKAKASLAWSEPWQNSSASAASAGGFAFAAIRFGNKNIGFFSVQLGDGAAPGSEETRNAACQQARGESARLLVKEIDSLQDWRNNRLQAFIVGGDFDTTPDDVRLVDERTLPLLEEAGFDNALAGLPLEKRITLPGDDRRPAATLDYIFTKDAGLVNPALITPGALCEHEAVTCEMDLAAPKGSVAVPALAVSDAFPTTAPLAESKTATASKPLAEAKITLAPPPPTEPKTIPAPPTLVASKTTAASRPPAEVKTIPASPPPTEPKTNPQSPPLVASTTIPASPPPTTPKITPESPPPPVLKTIPASSPPAVSKTIPKSPPMVLAKISSTPTRLPVSTTVATPSALDAANAPSTPPPIATVAVNQTFDGRIYSGRPSWEFPLTNQLDVDELMTTRMAAAAAKLKAADKAALPPPAGYPPRDPQAKPELIDLSPYYNTALTESWHSNARSDLAVLPIGVHNFAGVDFDVRGMVQVANKERAAERIPTRIDGIKIRRKCTSLHFLHSAGFGSVSDEGQLVGSYIVHFAGKRAQVEIPIIYGRDVRNWHKLADEPTSTVASQTGRGGNGVSADSQNLLRLFTATWVNVAPGVEIESIDFVSSKGKVAPFLIAITAE
jgi:hypothetical protein